MILYIQHVSLHVCFNVLGSVGVFEGVVSVFIIAARRRDVGNHHSSAVASQGILQESGELRISERNVVGLIFGIVLVEHVDAVPQS